MTAKPVTIRLPIARLGFYIVSILLIVAMWKVTTYVNTRPYPVAPDSEPELDKAVDAYEGINNLLITLGTGLLGAMGFLLTTKPRQHYRLREMWPAVLSAVCVGLSLYFGYVSYQNVEFVLLNSVGTLDIDLVQWPKAAHFYTLLAGVFFFADFVMQDLGKGD
ncbi:MAG: hypothetical protein ABSB23_07085 [Bryobacteraceae bacterium]|jgi:TRAP-type C4-dicarboxylate transport system permease small subunit